MHLHILGVAGSFMAGVARIARERGHRVTGSDAALHPPMSGQLAAAGIDCRRGYDWAHLQPAPDCVLVGNVLRRGEPVIERLLDSPLPFASGPQWLREHVLRGRRVLAVAGTHGKTTTAAMLEHILRVAGRGPGCLIGGVPAASGCCARAGSGEDFVIEADEYDTAFFDKRSKFVHYAPRILILNNLEFDHADIFDDLAAIERQFHHLLRTVPSSGRILCRAGDARLARVLGRGCWTPVETFGDAADCGWRAGGRPGGPLEVAHAGAVYAAPAYRPFGRHNALNATAAVAAAHHAGVAVEDALAALGSFRGVLRRLSLRAERPGGGFLYDDFAHHPTEIRASIAAVRERHPDCRVLAVAEPASNSMRAGAHRDGLAEALGRADRGWLYAPDELAWDADAWARPHPRLAVARAPAALLAELAGAADAASVVLVMSNRPGADLCERVRRAWGAAEGGA